MKLKAKNFNWLAGRPVVILNQDTAKKLNVHVDERVLISLPKKFYAVVDIFEKIIKDGEIGLSFEISKTLNVKDNSELEVSAGGISLAGFLIRKKILGNKLSRKEIEFLVSEIIDNNLTESEIAYFAAAEKMNGMSMKEIIFLTKAMINNGKKLNFKERYVADKHCIGGIAGNRTTPIVVAICACAGLILPKTSSRAITSASGTADVIETISKVEFSPEELKRIVKKTNACLAWGGSLGLAPSDDKIIQVERILNLDVEPQLLASIISKKISAGSKYILIDIPYGKSAKEKTKEEAEKLARKFKIIAKHFRIKLKITLTDGTLPIGKGIGPVLEMLDVLAVLQNKPDAPEDLKEKSLFLASELMKLCSIKNSASKAKEILESGKAYEKFRQIINVQNGKNDFDFRIKSLKLGKYKKLIKAERSGTIKEADNKKLNSLARILGTPETISAGIYLYKHSGQIKKSESLMMLYSESKTKLRDALRFVQDSKPILID